MWCKGAWIAERCHIRENENLQWKMRIYDEKPELTRGKNAEKKSEKGKKWENKWKF